jgi:HK97 family phage major capsid protein
LEARTLALTLVEASKLSNDTLLAGVIDTIASESPILQRLPFIEIVGNGLTYNRENAAPTAAFYDVGDTWAEDTPTFTQATAALKILGGDADVDNFLKSTRSNIQDLEAAVVQLKARAVQALFDDTFVNGSTVADANSFDGIELLAVGGQVVTMGTNGGSLSLAKLDELIDKVRGGKPDMLLMSRRSRRSLNILARTSGSFLEADRDQFGNMLQYYDGIPIGINDYISDAATVGTSSDCSTVYAMQFGEGGLSGLSAPGGLTVERVGSLETKDASRIRVKWYAGIALFNSVKLAKLTGVQV